MYLLFDISTIYYSDHINHILKKKEENLKNEIDSLNNKNKNLNNDLLNSQSNCKKVRDDLDKNK